MASHSPCCPAGHALATCSAADAEGLTCDQCGVDLKQDSAIQFFSCAQCDYDICPSCAAKSDMYEPEADHAGFEEAADAMDETAGPEEEQSNSKSSGRVSLELRRLRAHENFNLDGGDAEADADNAGTVSAAANSGARDSAIDSGVALRSGAFVYSTFAVPASSLLAWPSGVPGACESGVGGSPARVGVDTADHRASGAAATVNGQEDDQVLGYPLTRLVRLLQTVYEWVCLNRSGRIDWEAIGRKMSTPRPGEPQPSLMTASEAHRLWRLLAYRMAAPAGMQAWHVGSVAQDTPSEVGVAGVPTTLEKIDNGRGAREVDGDIEGFSADGGEQNASAICGGQQQSPSAEALAPTGADGEEEEGRAMDGEYADPTAAEPAQPAQNAVPRSSSAAIARRRRPGPPAKLDDVELDVDSDTEEFMRSAAYTSAATRQTSSHTKAPRAPTWPSAGTPRLVGHAYPRAPGVIVPKIAEDGSGPLDLGLEPPRKVRKLGKASTEDYSLKEALRLTVTAKPWNDEEDRKLAAAVLRVGSSDRVELEKIMKRGWGSVQSRITKLQAKGSLPSGVVPPSGAAAPETRTAAMPVAARPGSKPRGRPRGSERGSNPGGSLNLTRGPDGLMRLAPQDVDGRLWEGAAAAGWCVVEAGPNGHASGSWRYMAPSGEAFKNRTEASQHASAAGKLGADSKPKKPVGRPPKAASDKSPAGGSAASSAAAADGTGKSKAKAAPASSLTASSTNASSATSKTVEDHGNAGGVKLTKPQAKALKGRFIEIYWDGESAWFEAEVLAYDEARKVHFVRYTSDAYECEEDLSGGKEAQLWRPVIKTTAASARPIHGPNLALSACPSSCLLTSLPASYRSPSCLSARCKCEGCTGQDRRRLIEAARALV